MRVSVWVSGSTETSGQFPGLSLIWMTQWSNKHFFIEKSTQTVIPLLLLQVGSVWSKLCTFLSFFSSRFAVGSCPASGMVAPHLTACMRNDKMGEASVLQNQTTVCNCPPLLYASQRLSSSSSSSLSCVVTHALLLFTHIGSLMHCHCRRCRNPCFKPTTSNWRKTLMSVAVDL